MSKPEYEPGAEIMVGGGLLNGVVVGQHQNDNPIKTYYVLVVVDEDEIMFRESMAEHWYDGIIPAAREFFNDPIWDESDTVAPSGADAEGARDE